MFTTRLISGIVLVILAAFLLVKGGTLLFLVSLAISLIGLFELYRVMKIEKELPGLVGYGAVLAYYAIVWTGMDRHVTFLAIAALMLLMTIYVFTFPKFTTEQITVAFFGIFYVGLMLSYLYQVRSMPDGKYLVWLIVLSSWGCDTCAYCVGMLLGKHKMAPKLSPKKTVEGAVGGVLGAALLGFLYGVYFEGHMVELARPGVISAAACAILPDRGSGGLCHQTEPRRQGLRSSDPRPRRDLRPVRQYDLYGPGHLLCSDVPGLTIRERGKAE